MKKALTGIFVLLTLAALCLPVFAKEPATPETPEETLIRQTRESYVMSQRSAGKSTFHGTCGLMVSNQLYCLGINNIKFIFDGNKQYDHYSQLEVTTGGYYVQPYSSEEYDLLGALQAVSKNGTVDVKNVLVGFQWTDTVAGNYYGHAVFINGIIDGNVYFVESFPTGPASPEGTVLVYTIEEFAMYYDDWTVFEGLVHFGSGQYSDVCPNRNTDITVRARFATTLRSQPALVGQKDCIAIRQIKPGEKMRATAIYQNGRTMYYQVETDEGVGYVSANAAAFLKVNEEGIRLWDVKLSGTMASGEDGEFSGLFTDTSGTVSAVEVSITDSDGQPVRRETMEVQNNMGQLAWMREDLLFYLLENGKYQVDIYVFRECDAIVCGANTQQYARILLKSYPLQVGVSRKKV